MFEKDSPFQVASEKSITAYETKIGARIPDDYRAYLLSQNGATPAKVDYRMPNENNWIESVAEMSGLGPDDDSRSLTYYLEGDHGIPEGWIPIAHSGYGDYTVLSVRQEDFGNVFYLFHEVHGYDSSNRSVGVYLLADSFSEWISGLDNLTDEE